MKILITGCGGMLGEAVYKELKEDHTVFATDIDLNEDWLTFLDVRYPILKDYSKPDIIIHLAALTRMEYCQLNPEASYDTNLIGTNKMVQIAKDHDIPFVYISSAGIFDGKKEYYLENDKPNPLSVYAKSKYAGELMSLTHYKTTVIRAGWMIGGGPKKDKMFINKLIKQIQSGAKELFVVKDKFGTPTYTYDLAKLIRYLISNHRYGIYHGTCSGGGSRVEIARELLKDLCLEGKIKLNAVDSDYFKDEYFAMRPRSEMLVSTKINSNRSWEECLKEYINKFEWKI
jgi:dTDP-4-dehydrorhamnose reductase